MELSNNLVSQFAKLNNTNKDNSGELVYGTTVMQGSKLFVNIDGSDTITPVVTMSDVKPGERVTVMIKDHSATIIGNITNPSAGTEEMGKVLDEYDTIIAKIGNFELIVADKVTTEQLEAELAIINEALIGKATIGELEAVKATIKDLDVSKLEADLAIIEKAIIEKADIKDLDALHADISILESDVARIDTLVGGQLTMDNIQSLILTSSKVTVDNAFIKDAMIDRVSASKLTAGMINTSLINIGSEDGSMSINGSLQQFKDANGNVRIQIGKDNNGDFTFALYGEDGIGQLINQNGITASAIEDGLIVNEMVAENAAITGNKLDINSVVEEINDSSTTIKSSKIIFDDLGQTLDVAFNTLESKIEEGGVPDEVLEQITTNTTNIGVAQGQINTLISNTTITKDNGETVSMKDDYSSFKQTVDGMSSKIGSLETTVDGATSKMSTIEQSLDSFEIRINDTETTTDTIKTDIASLKLSNDEFEVEIAKKTDKNSIISTINASTEGITISSSKINITGFVTFSDLSRSGSTTIHGDNIISGTINADKITGGTLTAMDKICFENGVTITANNGETEHGLVMSAGEYVFGGATNGFLNGVWWVDKLDVSDLGIDNYQGTTINMQKPISVSGSISGSSLDITNTISGKRLEIAGDIVGNNNLYAKGSYLVYHTGNKPTASDVGALPKSGGTISGSLTTTGTTKANRLEASGDVVCNSVWAKTKVYANNVALTSDVKLKTDIKYVNVDKQTIGETGLLSPNVNITTSDMHEFIETLPMTSYRMTSEINSNQDYTYYGFIAQDILYTKVGSELIEYGETVIQEDDIDEDGNTIINYKTEECLRYSENKFIAFICGALQEEIRQRKDLEKELNIIKAKIKGE
jgi:hypothetical protein